MAINSAKIADIVRCSQRDELFVASLQDDIYPILQAFGSWNYRYLRHVVPFLANTWYYFLTSVGNLQTLGEEYTGILRFTQKHKLPSKLDQILWLVFYIGGESFYDRLLDHLTRTIQISNSVIPSSKKTLLNYIKFMKENKLMLLKLHHAVFYMNGTYYNISNRVTGIKYVLLRDWLVDNSSTWSFNILGKMSFLYIMLYLIFKAISSSKDIKFEASSQENFVLSRRLCSLCTETRKNTCATLCGHLFCWDCIYESLSYSKNCPICREILHPSRIIFLQNYI